MKLLNYKIRKNHRSTQGCNKIMLKPLVQLIPSLSKIGLTLFVLWVLMGLEVDRVQADQSPLQPLNLEAVQKNAKSINPPLTDGVYFFGQSPQPNQWGATYLVFKVHQNQVSGVMYQPDSEYVCMRGTVNAQQLTVRLYDPTESQMSSLTIPVANPVQVAGNPQSRLSLTGYHRITPPRELDYPLLETCGQEVF